MKRITPENISKLTSVMKGLFASSRYRMLRYILANYHPADIVLALKKSDSQDIVNILRIGDMKNQVEIFPYFVTDKQLSIIRLLKNFEVHYYFEKLPPDERTNLLREMDESMRTFILEEISERERAVTTNLLSYGEDTAASIVTYATVVRYGQTVQQTLDHIRTQSSFLEDVHNIYVLNDNDGLVGIVTLEQIVFSDPQEFVSNLMTPNPMYILANQPKEDAVEAIQKYDIPSLPVVDDEQRLLGIITYDDAMDLLIQQGTEDIYRFAGVTGSVEMAPESYLKQSIFGQVRRRFTWTIIPIFMEIITGHVIGQAQTLLQSIFILATFIPMIAAAGGNIGSQSASLVTRAIALKELDFSSLFAVLKREFLVSSLIAVVCVLILVLKLVFFPHIPVENIPFYKIVVTVSLALALQLVVSALLGAFVPMLAIKLKIDPAIMSSPVLASSVDIIGLLIFFSLAKLILF